jgi:hypothetical protein
MRALLGLLVLGTLFVMAASWQNRTTRRQHDARARSYNTSSDTSLGGDWSRLLVGRASGAEPLAVPDDVSSGPDPEGDVPAPPPSVDPPVQPEKRYAPDRVHIVQPNEVLGTICQAQYEVRPLHEVVARVARYNELPSPDAIRVGMKLLLPDPAVLFADR